MIICPNFSNPTVKQEFDELVNAVGEVAAYDIWSQNNGNSIDFAPNGEQSKLFSDLLTHYNGNRTKAIQAKAKVYSKSFKNWFGDWLSEDKTEVSKVVDENGEPLIVYHGTLNEFDVFSRELRGSTDLGDWGLGFYFSPRKNVSEMYGNVIKPVYLSIKNPVPKEKFQMTDSFGRGKAKSVTLREKIQEDIDVVEFSIKGYEEKLYGNDPDYDSYREEGSMHNKIAKQYLERYKNKLIDLQTQLQEKSKEELDFDVNKKWNDAVEEINKYDGIIPNINSKQSIEENHEIIVKDPNQIKSIDNQGTFSVSNNNIHQAQKFEDTEFSDINFVFTPSEQYVFETVGYISWVSANELLSSFDNIVPNNSSIFRLLFDLFKKSNVRIVIADSKNNPWITDYYAFYDTGNDTIYINSDKFNQCSVAYNAITVVHELVHAHMERMVVRVKNNTATEQEVKLYKQCEQIWKKLYNKYKNDKVPNDDGELVFKGLLYGLNNVDEFIAELMSNNSFTRFVMNDSIDSDNNNKFLQLLYDIADYVMNLLGINTYTKQDIKKLRDSIVDVLTFDLNDRINNSIENAAIQNNTIGKQINNRILERVEESRRSDKEQLDLVLSDLANTIKSGFESMLKVSNDSDPVLRAQIRAQAELQIANISEGLVDNLTNINNFLNSLGSQLTSINNTVFRHNSEGIPFTDEKLNDLDQNFYGFYTSIVDDIIKDLSGNIPFRNIIGKNKNGDYILDIIVNRALLHKSSIQQGHSIVQREIIENAKRRIEQVGISVNPAAVFDYCQNSADGVKDISFLTRTLGSVDKVNNDALKTIFYLIDKANEDTNNAVYKVQNKLMNLLNKAGKYNQRLLFEVDDNGNTTGWIVRARNYGKFEKNYKEQMDKICLELGIDPSDLHLPENRAIRIEYNKRRNQWLGKHCDRRYTTEYYDMFNHLSEETQKQRESLQVQIRGLLNKTIDQYGITHREKLSPEDRLELTKLNLAKKQLASIYDVNGIKKQGIQLKVAEELTELNEKLSKGLSRTKVSDAFYKEKERIMNDPNLSDEEKQKWIKDNTRVRYKKEFYDQLKKLETKYYGKDYAEASERRRAILSQFRDDSTGEIQVEFMPLASKTNLIRLEAVMRRLRKVYTQNKKVQVLNEGEPTFSDIAHSVPTSQWYRDKKLYYDQVFADDPDSAQSWINSNAFIKRTVLPSGKVKVEYVPKSWYTKIVPNDSKYIEEVPNEDWLEVDESSEFINKDFIEAKRENNEFANEYWIPKLEVNDGGKKISYDTRDRYNRVIENKDLNNLRNEVLNVISEANSMMTNLNRVYPFRIPQKSGNWFTYMSAGARRDGFLGLFKGLHDYLADKISVRNDDPGFNKKLLKPNGDRLNLIPQNFILPLDNPEYLNTDLIGSVVDFYRSAMNWSTKTKVQPQIEILKQYIRNIKISSKSKKEESNLYKMASSFIDMNLYDIKNQNVEITIGKPNEKGKVFGFLPSEFYLFGIHGAPYIQIKPRTVNITKLMNILRQVGVSVNLGLNLACAFTGGVTALYTHITNMLVGRYYNGVDAGYALKNMLNDIILNVMNRTGVTKHVPKMSRLMEYYRVGADIKLDPTNNPTIINQVLKHSLFGIYTLQDHLIKGQILGSVANNFKLVTDSKGRKRFMSREEYKRELSETNNLNEFFDWNFGDKLSFYDAIDIVNGEMVAIDPENKDAVEEVKHQIGSIARVLAGSADGQLTDLQRPALLSNILGQFLLMHRQYLPIIIQERYTMSLQYDYSMQRYREALFTCGMRIFNEAKQTDESLIRFLKQHYKNDITFRENTRKLFFELGLWFILSSIIRPIVTSSADDDRKNILKQLIAYILERSVFETLAPYNLVDMANTLKSPFAIMNYIQNMQEFMGNMFKVPLETLYYTITNDEDKLYDLNKRIKKGAYKGMTNMEKQLIKLTPAKNVIELQDIQSKRNYYRRFILKEE